MAADRRAGLRGATAVVGIGQTPYYKRGQSPDDEQTLCLKAIVAACEDAGLRPEDVDGFVSYGADHSSGPSLMTALGSRELRFSTMVWNGGGGGVPGALGVAASAVVAGQAECVAVYRAMAEGTGGRLRSAVLEDHLSLQYLANGVESPAQVCALRTQRLLEADGVPRRALRDLAKACYHHAHQNPRAFGREIELDDDLYEGSRWISEPLHLFDSSRENDAAAAVLVVSADRARDLRERPAFILSAPMGSSRGWAELDESSMPYTSAGFESVARRLWSESGYGPADVDVVQVYENFTGPAVAALIDHGFCTAETAGEVLRFENLVAPSGGLPLNTSGGNLAEGFAHGMGLVVEAVRQLRGSSPNQVPGAALSLMTGGPAAPLVSSALFGSADTL